MRTRTLAVVGFAALLVLSGCSAIGGQSSDSDLESASYPEGTSPDGITNASQVLRAHQTQLAQDSYRLQFNLTYARGDQTGASSTVVSSNQSQQRQLLVADLPGRHVTNFATPSTLSSRIRLGGDTSYQRQEVGDSMEQLHRQGASTGPLLQTIVASGNYTANSTGTIQGHPVVWFTASSTRTDPAGQIPDQIERYNASLAIDEQGRIWRATMQVAGTSDGTGIASRQEYETVATGDVTVERPTWLSNVTA